MIVYHGTSWANWQKIKTEGLRVRGSSSKSNWTHSIESNPDTVYLTNAYAIYFGLSALSLEGDDTKVVVIEMDTDDLPGRLVPDEDALEQVARNQGSDGLPKHWSMQERTRYYRGMTSVYAEQGLDFEWSMSVLGTGGHLGDIPASCFRRVAIFDPKDEKALAWAFYDTSVSVINYQVLGPRWRSIHHMIFEDPPEPTSNDIMGSLMGMPAIQGNVQILNFSESVCL